MCKSTSNSTVLRSLCMPPFLMVGLFVVVLLGGIGCQKEDQEPPSIEILSHLTNFSEVANQVIRLEGRATDNEAVVSVIAQMRSMLNGNTIATGFATLEGNEWKMDFQLGDRYSESGTYVLQVTASDAAGLTASDFRNINLAELPLKYYGLWIAGRGTGNGAQLYYLDSLNQMGFKGAYGADLSSMHADNESQSLLLAEGGGRIGSYNDDLSPRYEVQVALGSSGLVNAFFPFRKNHYVGQNTPPYLHIYTPDGAFKGSSSTLSHGVNAIARSTESLFLGGSTPGSGQSGKAVSKYDIDASQLVNRLNTSFSPIQVEFSSSNSYLYVLGNSPGNGELIRMETSPVLTEAEALSFSDSIRALAVTDQAIFVLAASGLYQLSHENWGSPNLIYPGDFQSLFYEPANDRIFLGGVDHINELRPNGAIIRSHSGNWGLTMFLAGHFNK